MSNTPPIYDARVPPAPRTLQVRAGFASETGRRAANEDYCGACLPVAGSQAAHGSVAAVADGVGGHRGGRVAAETTVRSFLDAYYAMPETLGVPAAAGRALEAANRWIFGQGRSDPALANMASTFSGLVVRRRTAHILHVGDSRVYKLRDGLLQRLTTDHVLGRGDQRHVLTRAIGLDDPVKFDLVVVPLHPRDRFLLCTDGVHGALADRALATLLGGPGSPDDIAQAVVTAALEAGSADNCTALVVDVLDLPAAEPADLQPTLAALPLREMPRAGDTVDGFRLHEVLSDGRYSRLFRASDGDTAREVVLKFPHPRVAQDASFRLAFLREAWVATRIRSSGVGEMIELAPGRQTRLYSAMPFYEGETLEQRLTREPPVSLADGTAIAAKLGRAITALHRAHVIHRDIKPENVILLHDGGLRLIDLGVARVPDLEEFPSADNPGTPAYMAPELFEGAPGDEASDLYALGITLYRMFARRFPYGESEPPQKPRPRRYMPLTSVRSDLPAWLDAVLARAVAVEPAARQGDVLELAYEMEHGATWPLPAPRRPALYARNPLLVWQLLCALLALACAVLLARR